jgi:biotin carboxylase
MKDNSSAVVLVDPASSGAHLKKAAKDLGYKVIGVFTQSKKSFEELYHLKHEVAFEGCDSVIVSSEREEILEKLMYGPFAIKAVIAGSEIGVELADQLTYAFDLWGNAIEYSKARRHKGEMRQALKKSGLSCPDFFLCTSEEDVIAFAEAHRFPLIIKTPKGVMTSQVYECDDLKSLVKCFHKIYDKEDIFGVRADCAIVEEYISGREYIIDTFSDGQTVHVTDIWVYDFINAKHFKNIYYNAISLPVDTPALKALCDYAIAVAKVLGVDRGAAHIELKDDPVKGPTLIEIGARLAGMHLPEFMRKYSNFNPYTATIEVFTQGKTSLCNPIVLSRHCAVVLCPLLQGGKVKSFAGIKEIEQLSSYNTHQLNLKRGDVVEASTHGVSIPLVVFLAHPDRIQLLKDVHSAHELFVVHFEGEEPPSQMRQCG